MVVVYSKPNMPNFKYELVQSRSQAKTLSDKFYPNTDYQVYTMKQAMLLRAADGSRLIRTTIGYSEFRATINKLNE